MPTFGIVTRRFRAVAVGAPGVLSRVGLGTFLDPKQDLARERRTVHIELMDGRKYLLYKAPKPIGQVGLHQVL